MVVAGSLDCLRTRLLLAKTTIVVADFVLLFAGAAALGWARFVPKYSVVATLWFRAAGGGVVVVVVVVDNDHLPQNRATFG